MQPSKSKDVKGKLTAQEGRLPRSWAAAKLAMAREKRAAVNFILAVFVMVMVVLVVRFGFDCSREGYG